MFAAPAAGDHPAMLAKSLGFSIAMPSIGRGKDNFLFIHLHPRHCGLPAMTAEEMNQAASLIESETDASARALLLAALVSEEFRARGFEPVIVGGSAIEFYTDGAYMSGDVDVCWKGIRTPTPFDRAQIMSQVPGIESIGTRSWKLFDLHLDLLGEVTTYTPENYTKMSTPLGMIVLQPVEDLLVERVFSARCWTAPNPTDEECARKLMAAVLRGHVSVDWAEVERVAALPAYQCLEAVEAMKREVSEELEK
jgi:hypothetical protein